MTSEDLLFRIYWGGVNQMVYFGNGNLNISSEKKCGIFIPSLAGEIYLGPGKLMGCSLVPDIDGKLIYESDIVECEYGTGVVVFKDGCYMIEWLDDKEANMEYVGHNNKGYKRQVKILGNIHENSDLLKKYQK